MDDGREIVMKPGRPLHHPHPATTSWVTRRRARRLPPHHRQRDLRHHLTPGQASPGARAPTPAKPRRPSRPPRNRARGSPIRQRRIGSSPPWRATPASPRRCPGRPRRSRPTCRSRSRWRRSRGRGRRSPRRPRAAGRRVGVLDVVGRRVDHARARTSRRDLARREDLPLVGVARVGGFEEIVRRAPQRHVDELARARCRGGAGPRSCPSTGAAEALGRDVAQRVVERLDVLPRPGEELSSRRSR